MTKVYLILAVVFGLVFVALWVVFLRPVSTLTGTGTIASKTFRENATYWQTQPGLDRGMRTPTPVPIAEAYLFEITLDQGGEVVTYALNTQASQSFNEGERVVVQYQRRGVPPFWERAYVLTMEPAQP
jgi:hypothetical protein